MPYLFQGGKENPEEQNAADFSATTHFKIESNLERQQYMDKTNIDGKLYTQHSMSKANTGLKELYI